MPKVSVIIPVYNTKRFLSQCIDSLRNQTMQDIEIIAIDDGSTDGSFEMLCEYKKKDKRIIVAKNKKKGVGSARNTGFELATGEYVGFLDSDDFVSKTMYEKLYNKAKLLDADVAIGSVNLYDEQTGEEEPFRPAELYDKFEVYSPFNARNFPEIIQYIGIWDRIYKKEFLHKNDILNVDISYEDHFYSVQSTVLADKICVVNEPFYKYRKNVGTSITDKEKKSDRLKIALLEQKQLCKNLLIEEMIYPIFRTSFLFFQFNEALFLLRHTAKFRNYKKIFNAMREMMVDGDYDYLETVYYNGMNIFSNYLQKNQLLRSYFWMKTRQKL